MISFESFDLFNIKELIGSNVWFIKDDLPDPETPVIQVNNPTGISTVISFKLFSDALIILIFLSEGFTRFVGIFIFFLPDKYFAVIEFLFFRIEFKSPWAQGNTVVVIEHNLDVIKTSDWVIDLGPEGGSDGGMIVAEGSPEEVAKKKDSFTGKFLKEVLS
mgnify:CR=1 FL=1